MRNNAHAFILSSVGAALLGTAMLASAGVARAAEEATPDNGTDPTRISNTFIIDHEHLALRNGFTSDTVDLKLTMALAAHTGFTVDLPIASVDAAGESGYGIGDISFKVNNVSGLTPGGANVFQAELFLDTAERPELGNGQEVLKLTYIRAIFLENKSILAPSFIQNIGLGDTNGRARVNNFVFDLYYVPHFKNPNLYMTVDPNITYNWDTGESFTGLLVTVGYGIGKAFGKGNASVYIKPSVYGGDDRPADWGIEVGYKVVGF